MNAYELADELTKMFQGDEYDRLIHEIPDMLRQQADDLKFWKDQYSHVHSVCETYEKGYRQQADRIAELEKQSEVREADKYSTGYWNGIAKAKENIKPLTDEEIRELEELLGRYWTLAYKEGKHGLNLADEANDVLMRFRAIVRGEK